MCETIPEKRREAIRNKPINPDEHREAINPVYNINQAAECRSNINALNTKHKYRQFLRFTIISSTPTSIADTPTTSPFINKTT